LNKYDFTSLVKSPESIGEKDINNLTELVKQTELARINLRKETPLIQVIDKPILPLKKEKFGKAKGLVLGGLLAVFLVSGVLIGRKVLKGVMS
jgi:uncharacterized protein involved in exopolysaccharide biosynthesis